MAIDPYALLVASLLVAGPTGLALALIGLRWAQHDRRALTRSGINGLTQYMAADNIWRWIGQIVLSTAITVAGIALWGLPPRTLPPDASPDVVLRLHTVRYVLALCAWVTAILALRALWARHSAGLIAHRRDP